MRPPSVDLPPLVQRASPNQSARALVPYLVVVHRPAGSYTGSVATLCDDTRPPQDRVSAHVITDSSREATQLVPWDRKAWACESFNSASYNLEADDDAWNGTDPAAFLTAARIVAFLCKHTGIPPRWTRAPHTTPGVCRHYDLGMAGGGHTDPTTDPALWARFMRRVVAEHEHGAFRPAWGEGTLTCI